MSPVVTDTHVVMYGVSEEYLQSIYSIYRVSTASTEYLLYTAHVSIVIIPVAALPLCWPQLESVQVVGPLLLLSSRCTVTTVTHRAH